MKTRMQLENEFYEIIKGRDVSDLNILIAREFPKSRGKVQNLNNDQLQFIISVLKKRYE